MLTLSITTAVLLGVLLAVWLIVAGWAVTTGLQMRKAARAATAEAARLTRLIETAPALPLIVRADGRIEASERLAGWLGLARLPNFIVDFASPDGGLNAGDIEALTRDIAGAQKGAKSFSRPVQPQGSERRLTITGAPAAPGTNANVVMWVFDCAAADGIGAAGESV
jgi:hypothetical protein